MNSTNIQFVLIHSPLVGPLTWSLVADELCQRGYNAVGPELQERDRSVAPFWQRHAQSVVEQIEAQELESRIILVAHSGAGMLLPVICKLTSKHIDAYLFADSGIPRGMSSRLATFGDREADFRQHLLGGGVFPNWTNGDLTELIPDAALREQMLAEMRPRGIDFWEEQIPVFDGWPDAPCGYLLFSPIYTPEAEYARQHGWPVREIEAGHFHMLVDPDAVTEALLDLVAQCLSEADTSL